MSDFELRPPKGAVRKSKIIGRGVGSGRGKTAGKGHKGQKARSGGKSRIGFEGGQMPLYRRLAIRGFSNHPFRKDFVPINLDRISALYAEGETVSLETLVEKRLIKKNEKQVKILARGDIDKALTFNLTKISSAAKEKISKAGGTISS